MAMTFIDSCLSAYQVNIVKSKNSIKLTLNNACIELLVGKSENIIRFLGKTHISFQVTIGKDTNTDIKRKTMKSSNSF